MTSASSADGIDRRRLLAAAVGGLLAAGMRPVRAAAPLTFWDYLTGSPPPAMVAFNPSGWDPRVPRRAPYPATEMRADLEALRGAFDGLILYAYDAQVTPVVLEGAVATGMRAVLLGIADPRSADETAGVAGLLRRYVGKLAVAVCIGNEGINDNRYSIDDLHQAAAALRQAVPDGSDLWLTTSEPSADYGWPPLRAFGDFLAPNVHPAIDRVDLNTEAAVEWVRRRAIAIARAAGKPVLVKETGVPHGGGSFSPAGQAAFWREWTGRERTTWIPPGRTFASFAAAFEAFDTPWKAALLNNPMEGYWGLLAADRQPYPAFAVWTAARSAPTAR